MNHHSRHWFGTLEKFSDEVDRLFDELIHTPWKEPSTAQSYPPIDFYETGDDFVLEADLPGMQLENIRLETQGHILLIRGSRIIEDSPERNMLYGERHHGTFLRRIPLPPTADRENISAEYAEGILTIKIKKNINKKVKQ